MDFADIALGIVAGYLGIGICFATLFVITGVSQIDSHARHGTWGFRLLIFPGAAFLWPLLLRRWIGGVHEPPQERNPHRSAARSGIP